MPVSRTFARIRFKPAAGLMSLALACSVLIACGGSDNGPAPSATDPLAIDQSFGTQGQIRLPLGAQGAGINVARLQADGKLLLAGWRALRLPSGSGHAPTEAVVWRLNTDGSLDTGFGSGGEAALQVKGSDSISDLRVSADQRLLLAVSATEPCLVYVPTPGAGCWTPEGQAAQSATALRRLLPDGVADSGFRAPDLPYDGRPLIALQPDQRVLLLRTTSFPRGNIWGWQLQRFVTDGAVDVTFNGGQPVNSRCAADGNAVEVLSGGQIIAAGTQSTWYADSRNGAGICVESYRTDGQPEPGFAEGKPLWLDAGTNARLIALHPMSDGRAVISGSTNDGKTCGYVAHRIQRSGTPDPEFGIDGTMRLSDLGAPSCNLAASLLSPSGAMTMAGWSWDFNAYESTLAPTWGRLTAQGQPDPRFGTNGVLRGTQSPETPAHLLRDIAGRWIAIRLEKNADGATHAVIERRMGDAT